MFIKYMQSTNDLLNVLKRIKNFTEFEKELANISGDKEKGDLFELFCQTYLKVIYKKQTFKSIQLFKDIDTKISELNNNLDRESHVYEKNINWKNFKSNGLSNLNYKILYENTSKYLNSYNYHIIVDLEYNQDKKRYPNDYEFFQSYNKDYYRKFTNEILLNIKQ